MEESKNGSEQTAPPLTPRVMKEPVPEKSQVQEVPPPMEVQPSRKIRKLRTLTPIEGARHRYYRRRDHSEGPADDLKKRVTGPAVQTSKRRQGLFVLVATGIMLLGTLFLVFTLSKEKLPSFIGNLNKGAKPSGIFYSGNSPFETKNLQERVSRLGQGEHLPQSLGNADADFEVSTKEHLDAIKEKLDKVRSIKGAEEEKVGSGDSKSNRLLPEPAATPRRFDLNNFSAPKEIISVIPKPLQGTN